MTIEAERQLKHLKKIRLRYDNLLKRYGYKKPTTYAKLRMFTDELVEITPDAVRVRKKMLACNRRPKRVVG